MLENQESFGAQNDETQLFISRECCFPFTVNFVLDVLFFDIFAELFTSLPLT